MLLALLVIATCAFATPIGHTAQAPPPVAARRHPTAPAPRPPRPFHWRAPPAEEPPRLLNRPLQTFHHGGEEARWQAHPAPPAPAPAPFLLPALGPPLVQGPWARAAWRLLLGAVLLATLVAARPHHIPRRRPRHAIALVAAAGQRPEGDADRPQDSASEAAKEAAQPPEATPEGAAPAIPAPPSGPPPPATDDAATPLAADTTPPAASPTAPMASTGSAQYVDPNDPYKPIFWSPPRPEGPAPTLTPPAASFTQGPEATPLAADTTPPAASPTAPAASTGSAQYVDPNDPYKPIFWSPPRPEGPAPTLTSPAASFTQGPEAAGPPAQPPPISEDATAAAPSRYANNPYDPDTWDTPMSLGAGPVFNPDPAPRTIPAVAPLATSVSSRSEVKPLLSVPDKEEMRSLLFPPKEEMQDEVYMSIWDHVEELRERVMIAAVGCVSLVLLCFGFAKDLVLLLQEPVADKGVRFLQLTPGEYFFTTVKVAGYSGLLLAAPLLLYQVMAYVTPGLTQSERRFIGPIILSSSLLFYTGLFFSYCVLTPAALNFFVTYGADAVESLWSIDQYFEFVLVLMLSTGLSFQVPVVQVLLGTLGLVSSSQMLGGWRLVVVGATVVAAVLTPSTDPFTQLLLALPLIGLYLGGAYAVRAVEAAKAREAEANA